jgi:SAM-dependent methyltransferase
MIQGITTQNVEWWNGDFLADRPLQMEMEAIERTFLALDLGTPTCLDVGVTNPFGSLRLRRLGGYWTTVQATPAQVQLADAVLGEPSLPMGPAGELPFEDKQFDVVILARGCLKGPSTSDLALVQECHRVLKTTGYLILAVDYRKKLDVAGLLCHREWACTSGYDERQLFNLLKMGFDVLGVRTCCRFWVQITRTLLGGSGRTKGRTTACLYWLAHRLDSMLFFTKGYQAVAYGRRKGWRDRAPPGTRHGLSIGSAVLRPTRP